MRGPRSASPGREVAVELLLLGCCVWWVLACNGPFFSGALAGRSAAEVSSWGFAAALAIGLVALHALVLAPLVLTHHVARGVLALLLLAGGVSAHYMTHLGVYMDPPMLRNVLRTDVQEARELFSWAMLPQLLLFAGVPLAVLSRWRAKPVPLARALLRRLLFMLARTLVMAAALLSIFGSLASLMRNHKDLRYLINPAAPLWSLAQTLREQGQERALPLRVIGSDAAPGERMAARSAGRARPLVVVLVVGETARDANWGLSGYARQTTPELARIASEPGSTLIGVAGVRSCGTNTEVSLPCMFAPVGRRDYDERRIRGSESLLHVLARAGVGVSWRDNQSGCKGVCEGLPQQAMIDANPPGLCADGRCLDEALLVGLDDMLRKSSGTQLVVLHLLGSHGPAYFRRYPPAYARFGPACLHDDLRLCSDAEIVNAYDNTLLYTDAVLARLLATLKAAAERTDSAMLFVSDHGESLGERGLYLHGMPFAVAPDVQKRVPMVLWASSGFAGAAGIDWTCLKRAVRANSGDIAHDHLFHTLLGMLDVRTQLHESSLDLTAGCRVARAGP